MAKQQRSVKARDKNLNQIEHHEFYDDSLLPSADELARLKEIDPNIIDWIKKRAEQEQDFRHQTVKDRTEIIKVHVKNEGILNKRGLTFCFIILVLGLLCSFFLIYTDHVVTGSIFAGVSIVLGAGLLFNFSDRIKKDMKQVEKTSS